MRTRRTPEAVIRRALQLHRAALYERQRGIDDIQHMDTTLAAMVAAGQVNRIGDAYTLRQEAA